MKKSGQFFFLHFIEKTGKVGGVRVARSVNDDLDREAVRVIKLLPDFNPARNAKDEPVRVWYTLPVTFKLQEKEPKVVE